MTGNKVQLIERICKMLLINKNLRIFILALFAVCTLSLAACNTMEGAGEDIEDAGEAIQKGAK